MSPAQFWGTRLKDYFVHLKYAKQKQEDEQRATSELIRLQTFYLVNLQLSKTDKLRKPEDLWRFTWDDTTDHAPVHDSIHTSKLIQHLMQ
jgi:hypothetical protein